MGVRVKHINYKHAEFEYSIGKHGEEDEGDFCDLILRMRIIGIRVVCSPQHNRGDCPYPTTLSRYSGTCIHPL